MVNPSKSRTKKKRKTNIHIVDCDLCHSDFGFTCCEKIKDRIMIQCFKCSRIICQNNCAINCSNCSINYCEVCVINCMVCFKAFCDRCLREHSH